METFKKAILSTVFVATLPLGMAAQVKTGIDVLEEHQYSELKGKRIGLLTNPTGVNRQLCSTIDLLHDAPGVQLTTLFAPEHGVRGDIYAGEKVAHTTDAATGLPVYSLHGSVKKPTAQMLKDVDAIVYDIQDIGCRSYTFISTLGLLMESAAENGKEVIVLDRPNPLGGEKVEGPLVEDGCFSFISQYEIPYIYGLTPGELALWINARRPEAKRCRLTVVKMEGWSRSMTFAETGLPWVPTSPHIPSAQTAFFYPATGIIGELGQLNNGVGYTLPFQMVAAQWIKADEMAANLNAREIEGIRFRPIVVQPFFGSDAQKKIEGVQVYITDYKAARLTEVQWHIVDALSKLYPAHKLFAPAKGKSFTMFDYANGTRQVRTLLQRGATMDELQQLWRKDEEKFRQTSRQFYLY